MKRLVYFVLAAIFLGLGALPAQEAPQAGKYTARGKLLTTDGEPAANVTVMIEVFDKRVRRQVGYDSTRSDVAGEFVFDLEKYADAPELALQFNTQSPRYRQALRIVEIKNEEFPCAVELQLEPGSVGRGVVVDPKGNPIEGASVATEGSITVETNAQGIFEIFGLHAFGSSRLAAYKDGYSTSFLAVESATPTLIDGLRIEISPAANLVGVALDPFDKPIPRGVVRLKIGDRYRQERLKRDGTFAFDAVPVNLDGVTIILQADQFPDVQRTFSADNYATETITLRAGWPLELDGRVANPDGSPAIGSRVMVSIDPRARPLEFHTDAAGRWRASPLDPGTAWVVVALPAEPDARSAMGELEIVAGAVGASFTGNVDPWPAGFRSTFEVKIDGKRIAMTRTDSGRGALPGVIRYDGEIDEKMARIEGKLTVAENGATGTFRATAYRPGSTIAGQWDLREQIGEGRRTASAVQRRVAGAPFAGMQRLDLQLSSPLAVAGKVLLANGEPLGVGVVHLNSWNGTQILRRFSPITAGGAFRLEGMPEGALEIIVVDGEGQLHAPPLYTRSGIEDLVVVPDPPEADEMDPLP